MPGGLYLSEYTLASTMLLQQSIRQLSICLDCALAFVYAAAVGMLGAMYSFGAPGCVGVLKQPIGSPSKVFTLFDECSRRLSHALDSLDRSAGLWAAAASLTLLSDACVGNPACTVHDCC